MRFAFFNLHFVFFFVSLSLISYMAVAVTVENDHNVQRVCFGLYFLYLVPLCIFRVLLKKKKKQRKRKTAKKNVKKVILE